MQKQFKEYAYVKIKTDTHDKVTCFYFAMFIQLANSLSMADFSY